MFFLDGKNMVRFDVVPEHLDSSNKCRKLTRLDRSVLGVTGYEIF